LFDPVSNLWRPIIIKKTDKKPSGRSKHSAVFYDDRMWVFGGNKGLSIDTNAFWSFDVNNYGKLF
jgi:hypothetical protein